MQRVTRIMGQLRPAQSSSCLLPSTRLASPLSLSFPLITNGLVKNSVTMSRQLSTASTSASSSDSEFIKIQTSDDGIVTLIFNNPKQLNAMNIGMGEALENIVKTLKRKPTNEQPKAVILTGEGRAFSAGGDLGFLMDRSRDNPHNNTNVMKRFYERFLSIRELPCPTIAAINGPAIGAGLCVALACDIRVTTAQAKLGLTFTSLGLHPGMGASHFLPLLVGPQQASLLLLSGKVFQGNYAKEIGLVAQVSDDAVETAKEIARDIITQPPVAVRTLVTTLRNQQNQNLESNLWREANAQSECYATKELADAVTKLQTRNKKK